MSQFVRRCFVFISVLILYFMLTFGVNMYISSTEVPVTGKSRVLIMGDSHSQKSMNPTLFADAQNVSQTAEPYIVTYWKLKRILRYYSPDTLILSFSPHNLSAFNDVKFSDTQWAPEMFRRVYPIAEFDRVNGYIDVDYETYFKTVWKQAALFPRLSHTHYLGKYINNKKSDVGDSLLAIDRHFFRNGKNVGVSKLSLMYLDSIISVCQQNQIVPLLVSSPVHEHYFKQIPDEAMNAFLNVKRDYREKKILFLDGMHTAYPDSLFLNADHLNAKGANRFTKELITYTKVIRTYQINEVTPFQKYVQRGAIASPDADITQ